MAKSSTKRKFKRNIDPEQLAQVTNGISQAVKYVNNWKRREIFNMAVNTKSGELPVCVPVKKDAYLIGRHGIKKEGKIWSLSDVLTDQVLYFTCRTSAVIYSVCYQTGHLKIARDMHMHDSTILQLREELENFNYSMARARRKKDWWRVDHFTNLASQSEARLLSARDRLEKTINLAKYFKIWE